ncbi:VOC family protein [Achromobacter sp. Marseille-Q0513]|uniref:VOC family protein n=1 Tax=Achromobacter sp. Marseille-Q0513 TaxID=2829161 RepID=UPI0020134464|nr:VOC family protein [Achromobacter sp. Marseille-Q0513]
MPSPVPARLNLFLLYVADPLASVAFYQRLLDRDPLDAFPSYAAFALDGGYVLGLWASHRVNPPPPVSGHRSEIAFTVADDDAVRSLHAHWQTLGVPIEQPPVAEVFGLTFVALDPDGHRIRVCPR